MEAGDIVPAAVLSARGHTHVPTRGDSPPSAPVQRTARLGHRQRSITAGTGQGGQSHLRVPLRGHTCFPTAQLCSPKSGAVPVGDTQVLPQALPCPPRHPAHPKPQPYLSI